MVNSYLLFEGARYLLLLHQAPLVPEDGCSERTSRQRVRCQESQKSTFRIIAEKLFMAKNSFFSDQRFYSPEGSVLVQCTLHKNSFAILKTGNWDLQKVCKWQTDYLTLHFEEFACFGNEWRECETHPHIGHATGPQPAPSVSDSCKRVRCSL